MKFSIEHSQILYVSKCMVVQNMVTNILTDQKIRSTKNRQNSNFSFTDHSCKVTGQTKQCTATILRHTILRTPPVGCAFRGSDECRSSVPCLFFHLQSGCSSSSCNKTISRLLCCINTFFKQHNRCYKII